MREIKTKRRNYHKKRGSDFKTYAVIALMAVVLIIGGVFGAKAIFNSIQNKNIETNADLEDKKDKPNKLSKAEQAAKDLEDRDALIKEANKLSDSYFYDEAIKKLNEREDLLDDSMKAMITSVEKKKSELVLYSGPVHHVFFHSLIVYPELAFDGDRMEEGYNMWMTTVSEFKKMLPLLKAKGYVLVDIESLVKKDPNDPKKFIQNDLYLPAGKKPLVISQDDVNYYDYMLKDGFAKRLELDKNGEIVNVIDSPTGEEVQTKDGDVIPILDEFVKKNPDFSYRGAKGVIAVTGYQGALGYRITDLEGEELKAAQEIIKKLSEKLRATGWKFASHSYTHNGYFRDKTVTMEELKKDQDRWAELIEPYVGETSIYISPFGYLLKSDDPRHRFIVEEGGFNIYAYVGSDLPLTFNGDNTLMPRFNLDGFSMNRHRDYVNEHYFNVDEVYDTSRPKLQ